MGSTEPKLVVTEPELIKQILSNKEGIFPKIKLKGLVKKIFGDGIVVAEGEKWLKLRKLANHSFHGDCLKDMVPAMIASVETMLDKWRYHEGKEIEVCDGFKLLTSEVISRTAFGSSYLEGQEIFALLTKLSSLISRNALKIRFFGIRKFIRTKDEIEAEKVEKLLNESIMEIVEKRQDEVITGQASSFGSDFLGLLLKVHHDMDRGNQKSASDLIDECKTLYSPLTTITRRIERKVKLGKYEFPANVDLIILPLALHMNPDIWGKDAHLFKPERFSEGLAKATNGNAVSFLGFGFGPRICVGLNFASNEAKITLSMILQRHKFTLSPNYVHSPFVVLMTQPQHGVQILLQPL
ncbi:hypothetical protein BUALT_Bualt05G0139800 [Buddleja alternifolia]|uniref:Cytochrome P450 n=1 Tax=Buddleja alternifolia TaxID=168488 RepID=A0AAV6XRS8_9LAMI|nr:hypothetical protein BUALT_Bualt05G0139800 [Buddleja alternifolia]